MTLWSGDWEMDILLRALLFLFFFFFLLFVIYFTYLLCYFMILGFMLF
jgi:hypothetical protein